MVKQLTLLMVFLGLAYAKEADLLEFTTIADTHLSMQLKKDKKDDFSTHFVMHEHDDQEVRQNKFNDVTIDTIFLTLSPPSSGEGMSRVYMWGSFISSEGEIELNNSLNHRETLVIEDSHDHRGNSNKTNLVNGSLVREFGPHEKLERPEEHRITILAKKRTLLGKKSGIYEGQIHFVAISDA